MRHTHHSLIGHRNEKAGAAKQFQELLSLVIAELAPGAEMLS